ncbi:MAG: ABC transporter ATP-binding protein [Chloroflexota bacterium]|nr:MAG: ABC transporter ATP-binding protein [Chloroflexota bacterium]
MASNTVLKTERLAKRYGSTVAVKCLDLEVFEGEIFGFLGPNGAGKTTSISMMCGLLKPDSGQVWVHGSPISHRDGEARARVGVCPQNVVIWPHLTCLEQLLFIGQMYGLPGGLAAQRGQSLLEELGLLDKSDRLARTLSGGMQRRLNLAMALVHDPEIVVLDEPEAGLDPQSRVQVRDYIRSLARRKTIILTTHNMDEADRLADRVAIIDQGELLVVDTPEDLKRRAGVGDVAEIGLNGAGFDASRLQPVLERLACVDNRPVSVSYDAAHGVLTVRAPDMVNILPGVIDTLKQAGFPCGDLRLRQNTLEDVFIQLTGRRLRE